MVEAEVSDLPRAELMRKAQDALDASPPGSWVQFKFTCPLCNERCVLAEANTLRELGECWRCGTETPIEEGGFLLVMKRS
jgi:transcription elongation factor Elf1